MSELASAQESFPFAWSRWVDHRLSGATGEELVLSQDGQLGGLGRDAVRDDLVRHIISTHIPARRPVRISDCTEGQDGVHGLDLTWTDFREDDLPRQKEGKPVWLGRGLGRIFSGAHPGACTAEEIVMVPIGRILLVTPVLRQGWMGPDEVVAHFLARAACKPRPRNEGLTEPAFAVLTKSPRARGRAAWHWCEWERAPRGTSAGGSLTIGPPVEKGILADLRKALQTTGSPLLSGSRELL